MADDYDSAIGKGYFFCRMKPGTNPDSMMILLSTRLTPLPIEVHRSAIPFLMDLGGGDFLGRVEAKVERLRDRALKTEHSYFSFLTPDHGVRTIQGHMIDHVCDFFPQRPHPPRP